MDRIAPMDVWGGNENGRKRPLYEQVAARVASMVAQGTFRPGDKIPSVRALSRQFRVSISTVTEAYGLLEDRGLISPRPQSGYYVRPRLSSPPRTPEISPSQLNPTPVTLSDVAFAVMQDVMNPDFLPLGAAIPNPEFLPVDTLARMMAMECRRHPKQSIAYHMPPGYERLRKQIARRMMAAGCSLKPDGIIVTDGCTEAVHLALRAVCRPGDTVAVDSPTFFNTLQAMENLGLRVLEIPSDPETGMSLEALRYAADNNTIRACMIVGNFNNPLGSLMPESRKRELAGFLARRDIPLIEDDIYGDLSHDDQRPTVVKAYDEKGLVLLCSSFSKSLAPGYRIGWIAPGRFYREIARLKSVTTLAGAAPTQMAVAEFLANGGYDRHLRRLRRIYARQVLLMGEAVARSFPEGTRVTRPAGSFKLWVEMPEGFDSLKLHEMARADRISIAPGPLFSARDRFRNCLRLNAAFWSDAVEQGIDYLGKLAKVCREER
ncbi:PLP-dependent aminotransferase family protein [Geobacter sp. DSM 9736]|uniref:aminotransferase-like domain-containing protein n=1 Tax=Geobacter sp. DSM 9736 TaxID=1277350 RepID=UPI000B5FFD19|nr:PLP-dependent aminotransferase family protein [Geobacter sp. DSM 9736]SNB46253.1 transcriptional regulator, GntR family [Geobacter sp. DSM 9736]